MVGKKVFEPLLDSISVFLFSFASAQIFSLACDLLVKSERLLALSISPLPAPAGH
jgi:lipoprotein|nr:MAG TPA: hypothetical protein [Caudoviricetes sp.]